MEQRQILIVSGMSGAGKSTFVKALEDLGYFVVDNLPVELLSRTIDLLDEFNKKSSKLAFVIDARELNFLKKFPKVWQGIREKEHFVRLIFLDAADDTIVQRYKETRRRHPLERGKGIRDGIKKERKILDEMRSLADDVIATDGLNVHKLKEIAKKKCSDSKKSEMQVTLLSFGFKYGVPAELDLCFDSRFLKNPYFDKKLRSKSGLEKPVFNYVFSDDNAPKFVQHIKTILDFLVPLYQKEGKSYLTVAVGCTGGQHRSVALVESLKAKLLSKSISVRAEHREREKWAE